jgi:hypothetical protein
MTIEGDILKKIASIKKGINELKNLSHSDDADNGTKSKVSNISSNGKITYLSTKGRSNVLFLFDATGSMNRFWEETQKIMKEMVKRITKVGNVKLKCVAYRDYCDGPRLFEYSDWHTEAEPLVDFLKRIKCNGGGDTPEAVEDALQLAYEEKEMITRVILIGDAPPHSVDKTRKAVMNLAKKRIPVYTFLVGTDSDTRAVFREIAKLSNGAHGNLSNYRDLLDMMSITIVHDVGGSEEVERYIKKYDTSDNVKKYSKSLPSYKK